MPNRKRKVSAALRPRCAHSADVWLESLERRQLLSAAITHAYTPASVLTAANRQTLLNGLTLSSSLKSTLQSDLTANNVAAFDTSLLNYMTSRTNAHFFFAPGDTASIASYIVNNIGDGGADARADQIVAHLFPESSDSTTYSVNEGSNINWTSGAASSDPEFLHSLNRQTYWMDLSEAYRYTGQAKYANELISELSSWSAAYPTMAIPSSWSASDQKSWLLDMGIRTEQWNWSYSQLLGSTAWTKEANSLFLFKLQQQVAYMATATTYGVADNRTLFAATGWLVSADLFPEFTADNTTAARQLAWDCLNGQYYNDGSQHEQSPGYAGDGISNLLELKDLDSLNGVTWSSTLNNKLLKTVQTYYQFLTPNGDQPAFGDTYRTSSAILFLQADIILNTSQFNAAKPRARDAFMFGTTVAQANSGNPNFPTLSDRGTNYAMPDSGNYEMRSSGTDPNATQILFNAGPKGGQHGHYDLLNFELDAYGAPLISDPGLVRYDTSADRTWAVSTPAHNTISADGLNTADLEDIGTGAPGVVVDQYDVENDHTMITAHHFGYSYLTGSPVLSRSIYYDNDGTMLVLDIAEGSAAHNYTTSFLVPGSSYAADLSNGTFHSTNSSGGNVTIQSLLRSGQTANRRTKFVSNQASPDEQTAQQYYVSQSGSYVVFATLITDYNGTSAPNTTASWITSSPHAGQAVQLSLTKNGVSQTITFNPPALTRLPANATNPGSYCDLAYDSTGALHAVYYDRNTRTLDYTVRDPSGNWSIVQTLDNGYLCGSNPSMAIDSKNHVGISYTDGNQGDLKYAFFDGTSWTIQTVDARGSTGHYSSLAFSRKDGPVITYYDNTHGSLRMATSSGTGGFTLQTLDGGGGRDVGRFSHLVLDPDRTDATKWGIAYEDSSGGYTDYMIQGKLNGGTYNASTGYTIFQADHSTGGYISLAFDSANRPSISHYDSSTGDLRWTASSGSTLTGGISFSAQTVASKGTVGTYTAQYYDSAGKATILYWDKSHNKLVKARLVSGKWSFTNLATGGHEIHVAKKGTGVAYTNVDDTAMHVLFM